MPIICDVSVEMITAGSAALVAVIAAIIAAVGSYRKDKSLTLREESKAVFDQQKAIIADLRKRTRNLEEGHDELREEHIQCEKDRLALQSRVEKLEEAVGRCTVPNCPISESFKRPGAFKSKGGS